MRVYLTETRGRQGMVCWPAAGRPFGGKVMWSCTRGACSPGWFGLQSLPLDLRAFRVQHEQCAASDQDGQTDKIEQWDE